MCYQNLAVLACATCHRNIGDIPTGTSPCEHTCGNFLSRHTDERRMGECGVCEAKREESARRAAALRKLSMKKG